MPGDPSRRAGSARRAGKDNLSANLIQHWLSRFGRGELVSDEAEAALVVEYEANIAAFERKVGELTVELDLLKKTPRMHLVSGGENSSIVSGPMAAPSGGGAK